MRILNLNVRHGGGQRALSIVEWCLGLDPDIVFLTEWRDNAAGRVFCDEWEKADFQYSASATASRQANGICVVAKTEIKSLRVTPVESPAGELILVTLGNGIRVLGCYFPQSKQKIPFFSKAAEFCVSLSDVPLLLIGDFNTGRNDVDRSEGGTKYACESDFISLASKSRLIDLWRAEHGENSREWTWLTAKNGFRIDHAFGNQALLHRFSVGDCHYNQSLRELGITDHSAMILELNLK